MPNKIKEEKIESSPYAENIKADKILMIHNNMKSMLVSTIFGASAFVLFFYSMDKTKNIWAWLSVILILSAIRWMVDRHFTQNNPSQQRILQYGKLLPFFSFLAGSTIGSLSILFTNINELDVYTYLVLMLSTIMTAGSIGATSSQPRVLLLYAIPSMLPIGLIIMSQDTSLGYFLGTMIIAFIIMVVTNSRNLHSIIHQSLTLKYKNLDLVDNLKIQADKADKANADKSYFLATASHDLRQPLHAINLFVEALGNSLDDNNKAQSNMIKHVRHGLDSMEELFNALLDISRIDAKTIAINKQHFRIDTLIKNISQQYQLELENTDIQLFVHATKQTIYSDPALIERIIRNLLSNAVQYTTKGTIQAHTSTEGDSLSLHIKDSGIGIAKEQQDNIFNEFTQLNNPERDRSKGLGLGLAIVRRLSNLLEHPITLQSKPNVGTEFIIQLPISQHHEAAPQAITLHYAQNKLNGLKVMLIDNEKEIIDAMEQLLTSWGCKVLSCISSQATLQSIQDGYTPEIIISDFRMPGELDGIDLIKKIQAHDPSIPSLIISGDTRSELLEKTKKNNIVLLTKPVKPTQLRIAINQQLQ